MESSLKRLEINLKEIDCILEMGVSTAKERMGVVIIEMGWVYCFVCFLWQVRSEDGTTSYMYMLRWGFCISKLCGVCRVLRESFGRILISYCDSLWYR